LAGRVQDQCLRIGLLTWLQAMNPQEPPNLPGPANFLNSLTTTKESTDENCK
jgi:hypothetical protein